MNHHKIVIFYIALYIQLSNKLVDTTRFSPTISDVATTQELYRNANSPEVLAGEIRDSSIHLFAARSCQIDADSCYTFWIDIPTVRPGTYQALYMYFTNGQTYWNGPNGIGGTVICIIERVEPYLFFAEPGLIKGTFAGKVAKQPVDPNAQETLIDVYGRFSIPDNIH